MKYGFVYLQEQKSLIEEVWETISNDGLVPHLFYDGYVTGYGMFEWYLLYSKQVMPFLLYSFDSKDKHTLLGLFWLNNFEGRTAQIHFTATKASMGYRRKSVHFGNMCLKFALSLHDNEGFLIDTLLGITPVSNKLAVKYVLKAGMTELCRIPKRCKMHYEDRFVDGLLSYATRETLGIDGNMEWLWEE